MNFVVYLLGKIHQVVFVMFMTAMLLMMKYMMAVQDNKQKSSSLPEFVIFMFVFVFMFMYLMFMMMVMKCF